MLGWWKKYVEEANKTHPITMPYAVPLPKPEVYSEEFEWKLCEKHVDRDYYYPRHGGDISYIYIPVKPTGRWKILKQEYGACILYLEVADKVMIKLDYMSGQGGSYYTKRWINEERLAVRAKDNEFINECGGE